MYRIADFIVMALCGALAPLAGRTPAATPAAGERTALHGPYGHASRYGYAGWSTDRPCNRRTDSFSNITHKRVIAVATLTRGATRVELISGVARITTDNAARRSFAVNGKKPLLATRIEDPHIQLQDSPALERLWPALSPSIAIDPAAIIVATSN